ncbi:hypothetical protein BGZ95_006235 [Linnemannia exigua]|uniref:NELF-A N-terminal domain-containing protein n=1 Tax=Linnemannia exigua TaxID=604196 RepID=A0AAD4DLC9_9FUNG|nr:hypothetical protein BGZ95_006235 [Linnemannia exigua]
MERLKGEGVQDWLSQHLTSPWHGHQTVASELGNEIISNIHDRWTHLGPSVQLGVLFSIISLKKAQQLQLKGTCQRLIDHACQDPDEWVKLVGRMLKDYPSEGSLRFNVEEFVDQAHMGSLLENLTHHINRDGIKFHPMEFAFLNESVCKEGQGKDPKTKAYPPIAGPSIQQHFKLKDSHVTIHTSRAERLKKMAEQASPVIPSTANSLSSSSAGLSSGPAATTSTAPGVGAGPGAGSAAAASAPGAPGLGGPPRPTKASSSGLFVRKPSGSSFLRSNAPRPMALPRNPSATQLPLRSPRVDQPTTPRLIQKASRIQILDIQQGNEIMQSMNDAKAKLEQEQQREKEMKREQRAQEIEAKRAQEAEKKAQALREKEEKKKEKEDAKKLKERQKQEREEQLQREKQEREQQQSQARETRPPPDDEDDDDEESSAPTIQPARKKSRTSSSRRGSLDDDDYDGAQLGHAHEPLSPVTPSLTSRYSSQSLHDEGGTIAMEYIPAAESNRGSDSYFPHDQQQPPHTQQYHRQPATAPPASTAASDHPTLFQDTNLLTADDRAYITAFMEGHPVIRPNGNDTSYQIVMNQEQVQDATGKTMYELILIEMNFETGEWRKIKRKRNRPHVPTPAFPA